MKGLNLEVQKSIMRAMVGAVLAALESTNEIKDDVRREWADQYKRTLAEVDGITSDGPDQRDVALWREMLACAVPLASSQGWAIQAAVLDVLHQLLGHGDAAADAAGAVLSQILVVFQTRGTAPEIKVRQIGPDFVDQLKAAAGIVDDKGKTIH